MSQSISTGFCRYAHACEPLISLDEWSPTAPTQLWTSPHLQILDIQRLCGPTIATVADGGGGSASAAPATSSLLYVALSDAESTVWAVVPPSSSFARSIEEGDVEVGCFVRLVAYAIVAAKGGKNVIVALSVTFTENPVSTVGQPDVSTAMKLSDRSLLSRDLVAQQHTAMAAALQAPPLRTVMYLVAPPDGAEEHVDGDPTSSHSGNNCGRWALQGRILWKSKLRRLVAFDPSHSSHSITSAPHTEGNSGLYGSAAPTKQVFDCVFVDEAGDAVKIVVWGSRNRFEHVNVGDCVRISGGYMKSFEDGSFHSLHFHDKSVLEPIADLPDCPYRPTRQHGACATPFGEVRQVLERASVGDVVSLQGVVVHVSPCTAVHTRRGRVEKLTLTLRDRSSAGWTVDVTLWDELARVVSQEQGVKAPTVGRTWCFREVVVRMFGSSKTLNSRSSSEAFELPPMMMAAGGAEGQQRMMVEVAATQVPSSSTPTVPISSEQNAPPSVEPSSAPSVPITSSQQQQQSALQLAAIPFSVTISEAIRTQRFALVKIQRIKPSLFYLACAACGTQMRGPSCPVCAGTRSSPRFLVRMDLSDGTHIVAGAAALTAAAEALFGLSTAEFLQRSAEDPLFGAKSIEEVLGLPLLVKLVTTPEGVVHVSELTHANVSACCRALALLIDQY